MTRGAGWLLLALLAAHAVVKARAGAAWDVLWLCPVASGVLASGLAFDARRVIAPAYLFTVAIGLPSYAIHLATGGATTWTSVLLHLSAPVAGWRAMRGEAIPRSAIGAGVAFTVLGIVASRVLTPPELNVNLAFAPAPFAASFGLWPNRVADVLLATAALAAGRSLLNARASRWSAPEPARG